MGLGPPSDWPPSHRVAGNGVRRLFNQFRVSRFPTLIVEGFQGTVEAENGVPPFAGDGLDPVVLLPFGRLGAEVDVVGAIGVLLETFLAVVETRETLIGYSNRFTEPCRLPTRLWDRNR